MRIAVLSYNLPVIGKKRGGIESVAHELADGLARRGHSVTVWSYDAKPVGALYDIKRLPGKPFFQSWLGTRLVMGYAGNFLFLLPDYGDVDIILAHGDSLLLPLKRRPVARLMHGSALGEMLSATTPWRFLMQLGVYVQELLTGLVCSGCISNSENTTRFNPFIKYVIPLGTDLTEFFPDPENKTSFPSILFVGALDGRKRGRLLIDWFVREIRPRHPDAKLHFVGPQGPTIEGVAYHTGLSRPELAVLYRSAWVYASPSSYEGFGLPYVEAMASGTPVVATPNPGSKEILDHGRFGYLAKDEEFAERINTLLTDPVLRRQFTAKGLERARKYSLERMVDSYENLLQELSERKKPQKLVSNRL